MTAGVPRLSEREKETLRLLLKGHDAKSIARELGLSIHTVNERLRDARRKLGVSSSREAARLLDEVEDTPEKLGDKDLRVARSDPGLLFHEVSEQRHGAETKRRWLIGGTFVMSLIIVAVMLSSSLSPSNSVASSNVAAAAAVAATASQAAAVNSARSWVALVDAGKWDDSWNQAGTLFKSQVTSAGWATAGKPVRDQVGSVGTRTLNSATKHDSLPGAPAGEYELVEFNTSFSKAKSMVETVVLAREASGWKVIGYFVKPA